MSSFCARARAGRDARIEVASWLEARSGGALEVEDSALHQALYRLEQSGQVTPEGVTENNRRARYYRITRKGRTHLRSWMPALLLPGLAPGSLPDRQLPGIIRQCSPGPFDR